MQHKLFSGCALSRSEEREKKMETWENLSPIKITDLGGGEDKSQWLLLIILYYNYYNYIILYYITNTTKTTTTSHTAATVVVVVVQTLTVTMFGCWAFSSVLISRSEVIGNPSFSFSILSRFSATISSIQQTHASWLQR